MHIRYVQTSLGHGTRSLFINGMPVYAVSTDDLHGNSIYVLMVIYYKSWKISIISDDVLCLSDDTYNVTERSISTCDVTIFNDAITDKMRIKPLKPSISALKRYIRDLKQFKVAI